MIDEKSYDAVITDIIMPRISGMDLLSAIRKKSRTLQVIIMTGEPSVDTAIRAVQSGANDYLTKPISKELLLKTVRNAVNIKRLSDEKAAVEEEKGFSRSSWRSSLRSAQNRCRTSCRVSSTSDIRRRDTRSLYGGPPLRVGNLSALSPKKCGSPRETIDLMRTIGYIHDLEKSAFRLRFCLSGEAVAAGNGMIKLHAYKVTR
jgi:response regulator RpfG family c-di-GMP phosphodiesterase